MSAFVRKSSLTISLMAVTLFLLAGCTGAQVAAPPKATATAVAKAPVTAPETKVEPTKAAEAVQVESALTQTTVTVKTEPAVTQTQVTVQSEPATTQTQVTTKVEPAMTPITLKMAENTTLGELLVDNQGMTLYTFKNDKPGESTCYDTCAENWPPLLVAEDQKPALAEGVSGKLGVIERKDDTYQVTYNDMPLYYYAQDTKAGEAKGQDVKDVWYVVSLGGTDTSMGETGGAPMPTSIGWIVAEKEIWLPVVDELGQHLQMAHQYFVNKDAKLAAMAIREGAGFLKDEVAHVMAKPDQVALQATVADLEKLATQVEQDKVKSIDDLNKSFQEAYQSDVEHRLNDLKAEERAAWAEMPANHLGEAIKAFEQKKFENAAAEIYKAIAFLKLEDAAATGMAKTNLQSSINDLDNLADKIGEAKLSSVAELNPHLGQAYGALASYHMMRASEAELQKDMKSLGYELKAAVLQLKLATTQTDFLAEAKDKPDFTDWMGLADSLTKGETPARIKIDQAIERINQDIQTLNQEAGETQAHTD